MRRPATGLVALLGALALCAPVAAARDTPARLAGAFALAGRVTDALDIPGEHPGQVVQRTWTFAPACATGGCPIVMLTRERPRGHDRVRMVRVRRGVYVGSGRFFGPLGCGGRTYRPGQIVPFTITVVVSSVSVRDGQKRVTRIAAGYVSRARENLTPCLAFLGHDAAHYHGHLV